MTTSWRGIRVRNIDGRTGVIVSDHPEHLRRTLTIECVDGGESVVQLNSQAPDSGELGWRWFCLTFGAYGGWLCLGHHNDVSMHAPVAIKEMTLAEAA